MESLPHWESLSETARTQLLLSVINMLSTGNRTMPRIGEQRVWDELHAAGIVQAAPDTITVYLTGPGACLVLDVMDAHFAEQALLVA